MNTNITGFQKLWWSCASDESRLSTSRVKILNHKSLACLGQLSSLQPDILVIMEQHYILDSQGLCFCLLVESQHRVSALPERAVPGRYQGDDPLAVPRVWEEGVDQGGAHQSAQTYV